MLTQVGINWRRFGTLLFAAAGFILALNLGRLVYARIAPSHAGSALHVPYVPYTVLRTESGFDNTGTLKYTNHYIEAERSDGSTMWRFASDLVQQRKLDFANGDHVRTNEVAGRKSTYPKRFSGRPVQRTPQASCITDADRKSGWTLGGEDTVDGHRAIRIVYRSGRRAMTTWRALDAACAVLQLHFEHETGRTEQNLSALILAEPDAALFQVPASFQEVPPSELQDACSDAGIPCASTIPDSVRKRLDKTYSDLRSRTP